MRIPDLNPYRKFDPVWRQIEQENLIADDACTIDCEEDFLRGNIHIMYHPSDGTLVPYLRYYFQNGECLTIQETEDVIARIASKSKSCEQRGDEVDHRFHQFGRLALDHHPLFGSPVLSIHVCNVEELLKLSSSQETKLINAYQSRGADSLAAALNWFALVGPYLGLPCSPSTYCAIKNSLKDHTFPFDVCEKRDS